jgi:hypothetical protein
LASTISSVVRGSSRTGKEMIPFSISGRMSTKTGLPRDLVNPQRVLTVRKRRFEDSGGRDTVF